MDTIEFTEADYNPVPIPFTVMDNVKDNGDKESSSSDESDDFETNLDSLIHLWYVNNSFKEDYSSLGNDSNYVIPDLGNDVEVVLFGSSYNGDISPYL